MAGTPGWQGQGFLLHLLPALTDNYIYLLVHAESRQALAIDPGEAAPVEAFLAKERLTLTDIWLTHHHGDHTGGAEALRKKHGARVTGGAADRARLPPLDQAVGAGDRPSFAGVAAEMISVPGHTLGHVAYHFPDLHLLFCGDTLFSLGCGRLFEGTHRQMFESLGTLARLPTKTWVCAAHEYTEENARFARSADPANQALAERAAHVAALRTAGKPTLPVMLGEELAANPFLRAADVEEFTQLRKAKDRF